MSADPTVTPRSPLAQRPGWLARLTAALLTLRPRDRGVRVAHIYHDPWCLHFISGGCDCHPDIEIGPDLTRGDS